ncbi:MAG: hypothetical protein OK474_06775 [Thaumarchaeota archaeon]|nr:hypothetical protein [Nitrososphaerota archaeon]
MAVVVPVGVVVVIVVSWVVVVTVPVGVLATVVCVVFVAMVVPATGVSVGWLWENQTPANNSVRRIAAATGIKLEPMNFATYLTCSSTEIHSIYWGRTLCVISYFLVVGCNRLKVNGVESAG